MDDMTTRVVIIGVNIFVTLTIVSLIVIMFFQMQDIYGLVAKTDTDLYSSFDDVYSMYDGKVETGIGLLNAIKRHEDNDDYFVIIKYPMSEQLRGEIESHNKNKNDDEKKREATELKKLMEQNKTYKGEKFRYEDRYNVTVSEGQNGMLEVNFIKIR